ncbi:MAG TPA: HAMP domain-containing sensor histidine kinase [Desulfosarcina sp.]|nr:HAMP domain-containing sensor histidine kinase [Desulfosarcina sp.]
MIAGLYFIAGSIYIYVSSHFAASSVMSKEQLEFVEVYKGFLFILATASILFAALMVLFRRLNRKEVEIQKQRDAIVAAGRQAMAGLFASSIAHDLNNLLTVGHFNIDMLERSGNIQAPEMKHLDNLRRVHDEIQNYADRLADISGRHLLSGLHRADMSSTVVSAMQLAASHAKVKKCSVKVDVPATASAKIDASLLTRALINAVVNAAEAVNGNGRVLVKLLQTGQDIRLEVHDNGPGILPEDRLRVLEPFYSTKADGTGLGLLSIRYCAEVHKGAFGIEESP